ncbi:MAG: hypothetical protein KAS75_03150 [Planctomycetes bacterium]|nr:hypothetical protein [Planctomycetota bacterium]
MARKRKKMALYEVISKSSPKSSYGETLGRVHPSESDGEQPSAVDSVSPVVAGWPKRPKSVQFNTGRIEISMPYQLAIALLLGIILLVLVVFRLGQITNTPGQPKALSNVGTQKAVGQPKAIMPEKVAAAPVSAEKTVQAGQKGNNRIVIQTYQLRSHLEPVKQYFAQFGIVTEILKINNWYYLVTKDRYENPEKMETVGYFMKQKIMNLGLKYKAPQGYETFGTKPFHDAYGKRFED